MEEFDDIKNLLKTELESRASESLRKRIAVELERKQQRRNRLWWIWAAGLSAVAAMLILVLVPSKVSAHDVLSEMLNSFKKTNDFEIVVDIRTRSIENFRYINLADDYVRHQIKVLRNDSVAVWSVDKGERSAAGRDNDIYTWVKPLKIGWHIKDTDSEDVLGYMSLLLSPEKIIESELRQCVDNPAAEYVLENNNGDIHLTVHAKPQGKFDNPYMLNASIIESENIRRYVIDSETKRLKRASVSVLSEGRETVVLKIASVSYGEVSADSFTHPTDVNFIEISDDRQLPGLSGLNECYEAASIVLNSFQNWDRAVLDSVFDSPVLEVYKSEFEGAVLMSVGKSFVSGNSSYVYVPYTLKLSNGNIKRNKLVLNMTDSGNWIVVGGL